MDHRQTQTGKIPVMFAASVLTKGALADAAKRVPPTRNLAGGTRIDQFPALRYAFGTSKVGNAEPIRNQ